MPYSKNSNVFLSVSSCPEDYPFAYNYFDENDYCCQSDPDYNDYCEEKFIQCDKDFCNDHKRDSDEEEGTLFLNFTFCKTQIFTKVCLISLSRFYYSLLT